MNQTIIKIGNSAGIILPKEILEELDFKTGETVTVSADTTTKSLVIAKEGHAKQLTVSPRLLTILDKVNKEYGPALKKLASL